MEPPFVVCEKMTKEVVIGIVKALLQIKVTIRIATGTQSTMGYFTTKPLKDDIFIFYFFSTFSSGCDNIFEE